jgi:hypothetical protein
VLIGERGAVRYLHSHTFVASALSDTELDPADAETFREIFWDLFRQGVITLGVNDANPEFPWFHLTALGKRVAEGESGYFVHDVSGYEKRITHEIGR